MDVVFAVVPFADLARPAIGVSLLKAELRRRGVSACVEYLNISFAATIGEPVYSHMCHEVPSDSMAGEWFFADLLFPNGEIPPAHEFAAKVLAPVTLPEKMAAIEAARAHRTGFIDRAVAQLIVHHPKIVGFTTTFHQTCACLAVAKRLKELPDPPIVVFGGANCEGVMGLQLIESVPWIDYVCTREGDAVFPRFVERYLQHGETGPLPGLLQRGVSRELTHAPVVEPLDALPIPEYEDYFEQLAASAVAGAVKPTLLIETSRGCWWGAKHHCTFCGLNGDTMGFRAKSPERVFHELTYLRERYGVNRIDSVDNILDMRYTTQVFPRLKAMNSDIEMFYEVKANLKFEHLAAMYDGGVRVIQPGIESFSDSVLALMRKGVTGLQNVQLLKWSEEVGISAAWNILAGFPDEDEAEYQWTAALLPLLNHLEPPNSCSTIRLDRFSPLFLNAERMGFRRVRPTHPYYYVFPLGRRELGRLAYFFDFDYADKRNPDTYIAATQREVGSWRNARFGPPENRPKLDALVHPSGVTLTDTRVCATARHHSLTGIDAAVYQACEAVQGTAALARGLQQNYDAAQVGAAVERLAAARLIVEHNGHVLNLGVWRNRPRKPIPPQEVMTHAHVTTATNSQPLLRVL